MTRQKKLLEHVLGGRADANIPFNGLCRLLMEMGFRERIKGSHHIYIKDGVEEIINLQSKGAKAKPYQVKQVRGMILKYQMGGLQDE